MARGGIHVTVSAVGVHKLCKLSRGMKVEADILLREAQTGHHYDAIVLPGGMPGAKHFAENGDLVRMLKDQKASGRWYAAICASPAVVFKAKGIATTETIVCYDYKDFTDMLGANIPKDRVVVSGKCITSVGPGSAVDFGLAIVECLVSKEKAEQVAKDMMVVHRSHPVQH
jgi:4-methyl-5(b-hydroxyethyl)-thiazole monophosphate biosynthesis